MPIRILPADDHTVVRQALPTSAVPSLFTRLEVRGRTHTPPSAASTGLVERL